MSFLATVIRDHQLLLCKKVDQINLHCANKIIALFELIIIVCVFLFRVDADFCAKKNDKM